MSKTIIVTGGAGFIGSNFVYHMLDKHPDYKIVCVDCLTYAGNMSTLATAMQNPNFKFYKTNICDRAGIYEIFEAEKPDIVVNFAAESHVDRSIENPEVFLQTNILGTQVMMDACRKYGITFQQLALAWLLNMPEIAVITAMKNPCHLSENMAALNVCFEPEDMKILNSYPRRFPCTVPLA